MISLSNSYSVEEVAEFLTRAENGLQGEKCEIIGEMNAGNPDYIQKLEGLRAKCAKATFTLGLAVREYNGRKFQNIKIWDIQIML